MSKSMLKFVCSVLILLLLTAFPVHGETGFLRTHQSVSTGNFVVKHMAVDPGSGEIVLSGYYSGESIFGGVIMASEGASDAFLIHLDESEGSKWVRQFRGIGVQQAYGVAVDGAGNSYVTGEAIGATVIEENGTETATLSENGKFLFVAKYDDQGNLAWHQEATSDLQEVTGRSVAVDASGNVYVAGWFVGTSASFGALNVAGGGGFTSFVVKYDSAGVAQWVQTVAAQEAPINGMIVDANGSATVAGKFSDSAQFGDVLLSSTGLSDAFVARYNSDGTVQWASRGGGAGEDAAFGLAADASGGVVIAGHFSQTASFGAESITSAGGRDGFVARYDGSGNVSWATGFGGTGDDAARDVDVHPFGKIAVIGEFSGTVAAGDQSLVSRGGTDAFVAFFSTSGNFISGISGGGSANDVARTAVWQGQRLAVAGGFKSAATFGDMYLGTHLLFDAGELFLSFVGEELPYSGIGGDFSGNGQVGLEDVISILQLLISGR